jgi:prevent-host-death family protein
MKVVSLRSLRRESALIDSAAKGEEVLVTRFGRPYVRIITARPKSRKAKFPETGRHGKITKPLSSQSTAASEWNGLV